jgi:dephospho-CoA kinase
MRRPVIAVTGGIGSGKTTVARAIAGSHGVLIDCDALGHRALDDPAVKRRLVRAFGRGILTPGGRVSPGRLAKLAFADARSLRRLNAAVRPRLRSIISAEVKRRAARAEYIVLDAVLYFQYRFRFKVDRVVATVAPLETRLRRIMRRDGFSRAEALQRITRQADLEPAWRRARTRIDTDRPPSAVERDARRIRDEVLGEASESRRNAR